MTDRHVAVEWSSSELSWQTDNFYLVLVLNLLFPAGVLVVTLFPLARLRYLASLGHVHSMVPSRWRSSGPA